MCFQGAEVTVIDISNKMLDKDREIARNENLQIQIVKGNICDLSMFQDCCFDYIINPPSLMYIPKLSVVFLLTDKNIKHISVCPGIKLGCMLMCFFAICYIGKRYNRIFIVEFAALKNAKKTY